LNSFLKSYLIQHKRKMTETEVRETYMAQNIKLMEYIVIQGEQIERNRMVTEALLTGLFDPNLQACAYGRYLTTLNGTSPSWYNEKMANEAEEGGGGCRFPTTVQGDNNETQMKELEERMTRYEDQLEFLSENVEQLFQERDEQLTRIEERLDQMEIRIAIMEKKQLEKFGLAN
jgi:hypothetical protein